MMYPKKKKDRHINGVIEHMVFRFKKFPESQGEKKFFFMDF